MASTAALKLVLFSLVSFSLVSTTALKLVLFSLVSFSFVSTTALKLVLLPWWPDGVLVCICAYVFRCR